jgi:nucleoside-diphosphate-sugar epimerase
MAEILSLVTGGSGYIASHVIQQLLENGERVHATVRDTNNEKKIQHLLGMQEKFPGKLELFEADLLKAGSFDEAIKRCTVVYHVASPFILEEQIKDGLKEVIEPALQGTQHVFEAVQKSESVTTVIFTSTVGAIFGDYADALKMEDQTLSEEYFNTTSTVNHNAYHYSKTMAEKEAWKVYDAQGSNPRWKLVTINPGLVLGPYLSVGSDSGSIFLIDELLSGQLFFGVPDLWFCVVDVREVAKAHISAAKNAASRGRYIVAPTEMASFVQVSNILRGHRNSWLLPTHNIPSFIVRLIGPLFGLRQKWIGLNLGIKFKVDNHRSVEELGIVYRPLQETLADHYHSWVAQRRK